jgi:hypothetical protein
MHKDIGIISVAAALIVKATFWMLAFLDRYENAALSIPLGKSYKMLVTEKQALKV